MVNCDICHKKAFFLSSINEDKHIFCPDCWRNKKEEINTLKRKEEEDYKRRLEEEREKEGEFVLTDRVLLMFGGIGLFLQYYVFPGLKNDSNLIIYLKTYGIDIYFVILAILILKNNKVKIYNFYKQKIKPILNKNNFRRLFERAGILVSS